MTNRLKSHLSISFIILFLMPFTYADELTNIKGDQILKEMFEKVKTIHTITYQLKKTERIKNKLMEEALFIKLSIDPLKVYSKMDYPKIGLEVLYNSEWEKQKAIINTNSFPWVNVKFSPTGKTMRKDQHHTILDSGYKKIISSIMYQYQSFVEKNLEMTDIKGEALIDGKQCWILEFENPNFSFINYLAMDGENLMTIADKFKLCDYMILENNKDIKNYEDVEANQQIKIPTSYSKKMILYIDKNELIPLKVEVYDTKGLFEQFEFIDVKLNIAFKANEFSEDFEEYNF